MIKIDKAVNIVINGVDVDVFLNVCEAARLKMAQLRQANFPGQWTQKEFCNMNDFVNKVFDGT